MANRSTIDGIALALPGARQRGRWQGNLAQHGITGCDLRPPPNRPAGWFGNALTLDAMQRGNGHSQTEKISLFP